MVSVLRYAVFKSQTPSLSRARLHAEKQDPKGPGPQRPWTPKALKTEQQLLESSSGRTLRRSWSKYPRARIHGGEPKLEPAFVLVDLDRSAVASLTCSLERR